MSTGRASSHVVAAATVCLRAAISLAGLAASCAAANAYTFTDLYSFCTDVRCADGAQPAGALAVANASDIFGATTSGGAYGFGVIFELTPAANGQGWRESVVYELCSAGDCKDGRGVANITADGPDTLYVVTGGGGNLCALVLAQGCGVVLRLTRGVSGAWTRTVIYGFCRRANCADGANPQGQILVVKSGAQVQLYGLTSMGGAFGRGALYRLQSSNGVWTENVIYSFCAASNCADGANPQGQIVQDATGAFYGVTPNGGAFGHGEVFKVTATSGGALYSFCSSGQSPCPDGATPVGGVVFNGPSALYGVTMAGGANGEGAAYQLKNVNGQWLPATIYDFCSQGVYCSDGLLPASNVIWDGGVLVGVNPNASANANYEGGVAFQLAPASPKWNLTILHAFCAQSRCADGASPKARLSVDAAGDIFGVAPSGGPALSGVVFELAK